MATTATETTTLIALTLPSSRYSAWMARYYVRATLSVPRARRLRRGRRDGHLRTRHQRGRHTDAVAIGLELTAPARLAAALAIVVTDPSPAPPVKRETGQRRRARTRPARRGSTVRPLGMAAAGTRARPCTRSSPGRHNPWTLPPTWQRSTAPVATPAPENWAAVDDAIRERMRELKMPAANSRARPGYRRRPSATSGGPDRGHHEHALVAISAVLRWRYDHLTNILHGQPEKNTAVRPASVASLKRALHSEVGLLKDDLSRLKEAIHAVDDKISVRQAVARQEHAHDPREPGARAEAISELPMLNDMDADYSPQYVKLARILRGKIKTGELGRFATLRASDLATDYHVSAPVAYATLEMLAANRYIDRLKGARYYHVAWDIAHTRSQAGA